MAGTFSLLYKVFFIPAKAGAGGGIHMDVSGDHGEKLPNKPVLLRRRAVLRLVPRVSRLHVADRHVSRRCRSSSWRYMRLEGGNRGSSA